MPLFAFNVPTWGLIHNFWDYFKLHPEVHRFASYTEFCHVCSKLYGIHNTTGISSFSRLDNSQPFRGGNLQVINTDGQDTNRDAASDWVNFKHRDDDLRN